VSVALDHLGTARRSRGLEISRAPSRRRLSLWRSGKATALKTERSKRSVMLIPSLARPLREHRLASPFSSVSDPVFASQTGTPLSWRNVERRG
jgi:hypothetical protein